MDRATIERIQISVDVQRNGTAQRCVRPQDKLAISATGTFFVRNTYRCPPAREGREGSSYNTNAVQLTRHFYTRTNAKNGTGDFNERGGQGGRIEIKSIEAGQCEVGCTKVRGNAIDQEPRNVWLVDQGFSLILRGETAKR